VPTAFRTARQGIHDAIVSAAYAGNVAKANGLKTWMSCSPDYAYGRDNTSLFLEYLERFHPEIQVVGEAWPKLFQADYTENITKILQTKPQALYSALWAGDLVSFVDQASIYGLFTQTNLFAINMADYTTLTAVKNLPAGIHSATRYLKTFPTGAENAAWADTYKAKHGDYPTNWSWENALAMSFLFAAMQKTNSTDSAKLADALRGMKIKSPFGADGTVTMRAEDQTTIGYALGWGTTIPKEPYVPNVTPGDWKTILEHEAEWKKKMGYA
jgi:branched-chain amino acid transport system substrate-binding protein